MDEMMLLAAAIHGFTDKDSDDEERIAFGSSVLNRLKSGRAEFGRDGNPPQSVTDVLYSNTSPYYETSGKNERFNLAVSGQVPKYNENQWKKDMAIAKGLMTGAVEPVDVQFLYRPTEETKLKKSGGHDFKKTKKTGSLKRYNLHSYK